MDIIFEAILSSFEQGERDESKYQGVDPSVTGTTVTLV